MKYEHYDDLPELVSKKLVSRRPHPTLPLDIYNYTPSVMSLKIEEWSEALQDCRGLILEQCTGEVVGRPFRKFWNYEQMLDKIPSDEPFEVWEKLDGSLGIVCNYKDRVVIATRGSFESEQAIWANKWWHEQAHDYLPLYGHTLLFEIIYPANRIVVDYGNLESMVLLAVMHNDGVEDTKAFGGLKIFDRAQGFPPSVILRQASETSIIEHEGREGYVVRWKSGFRAKVKFEEYKRLHRLITQVSTRSIWELLRAGEYAKLQELTNRVPEDFRDWVTNQTATLIDSHCAIEMHVRIDFTERPRLFTNRKDYAEWAKTKKYPNLLFAWLDQKPTNDLIWRMIEPKWSAPFRKEQEI